MNSYFDRFVSAGLIDPALVEEVMTASHLGNDYEFAVALLIAQLEGKSGAMWQETVCVAAVRAWGQSPLVRTNPQREALVGRELLHQLQPHLSLDFASRQTQIDLR